MLPFLSLIKTDEEKVLFADLYNKYCKPLHLYADRFLKNSSDAEDAVHDVFCIAAEKCMGRLMESGEEMRRHFLFICVRNRAINMLKHRSRVVSLDELAENESDIPYDFSEDAIDSVFEKEMLEKAKNAMNELDPIYSDVLFMQLNGYSVKLIAELFRTKEETIKKRLYRAKRMLREAVGMEGGEAL